MIRAAFLDRDGVLNRKAPEGEYITRWEDMELLPGVAEGITILRSVGFRIIVVSNQRCVAKGLITIPELESLHDRLRKKLESVGAVIDRIYYCPHDLIHSCNCRKPQPGMILEAAIADNIALVNSWVIGDSEIDIEAGKRTGCLTLRIGVEVAETKADMVAGSLLAAARQIWSREAETQRVAEK